MKIISPAKINLSLSVGSVRADGFHALDSLVHLLTLHDELLLTPADSFRFSSTVDLAIPDDDNLVVRAVTAMADLYKKPLPPLHFNLCKHIPHGAGLGGGSSNAAAAIYALSLLWNLHPADPKHLQLAADLGSDVPLFLAATAASIMTGRGELLHQSLPAIPGLPLLIVKPKDAHSSTAAVYQTFDKDPRPPHAISSAHNSWKNNLEAAATSVSPQTGTVLNWLRESKGVERALVAGSGSACWALCLCAKVAAGLQLQAEGKGWWAQTTTTADKGIYASVPSGQRRVL
ncbi:MAG: 4-(cytidine 5'-diphospho)-2-C-methyl-D-erythritol kinase [Coriobacteriia bacterium]|nr:4-(cytidine 5'-diphospho)-2-C-methyl-D-erythritol kinase [Coriobacteriia bacterium]